LSLIDVTNVANVNDAKDVRPDTGRRTSSSMSDLPDPSGLDLNDVELEQRLTMLEQQIDEKDKLIEGQHEVLQEYRAEIFRLRDQKHCQGHKGGDSILFTSP